AGQLAVPAIGLMVTSTTSVQSQTFTKITTSASPFINFNVNPDAPFGLSSVGNSTLSAFVDIDQDGDLDAFVGEYNGTIRYFENTSNSSTVLAFALSSSTTPFGLAPVTYNAAPTFVDIDQDGDLDAFVGDYYGSINYYQNIGNNSSIPTFDTPITNDPFGLSNVGNGAVPSFVDIDLDGDLDAFVGASGGDIYFFRNTSTDASIPAFDTPNSNAPFGLLDVEESAAPFFVDIDADGQVEVLIGQGDGGKIEYYKNTSTNSTTPAFSLISSANPFGLTSVGSNTKPTLIDIDGDGHLEAFIDSRSGSISFFENSSTDTATPAFNALTVDVGRNAIPTFVDIDQDGDLDLFVGEGSPTINFFKNIDTSTDNSIPTFVLSSSSAPFGILSTGSFSTPSFVDIDNDGQLEVFIGTEFGNISYYENNSTDNTQPIFSLPTSNPFGLTGVDSNASPTFVDIDSDGDLDAFVGGRLGETQYFENVGTPTSPSFVLSSSSEPFGLLSVGTLSTPKFIDIDSDGDLDAFVGEYDGNINYFENTSTNSTITEFRLSSNTTPFGLPDVGVNSAPVFMDVDGDNLLEAVIGNEIGRLNYFESDIQIPFIPPTPITAQGYCEQSGTTNPFDNLNISTDASPKIVDVDGDLNLDLISGAGDGTILYFQNDGSNNFIAQTGANNPFDGIDVGSNSKPQLVNVDGDNDLDLIIGAANGLITYYENIGNNDFTLRSGSDNPFNGIDVGDNAAPQLVNVDSDSDLDLIIGSALTGIFYYENQGNNSFVQQTGTNNPFNAVTGTDLTPQLIDVDGDMDLDLIIGNSTGTVLYYKNDGSNNFTQQIVTNNPFDGFDVGLFSIPHLADVDGDMDLDLLVGDQSGDISYFQNALLSVTASTANCTNNQGEVEISITSDLFGLYTISNAFMGSVGTADTLGATTTLVTGIDMEDTYIFEVSAGNGCLQVATEVEIDENCVVKTVGDDMNYTGMQTFELCDVQIIRSAATVGSQFTLIYSATDSIILQPGFHAQSGSTFTARIGDCLTPSVVDEPIENRSAEQTEVTLDDFIDERTLLSVF
ncbi:MAG: VCBS repeat-containing protein, partial [Bacteroidota bacterium]